MKISNSHACLNTEISFKKQCTNSIERVTLLESILLETPRCTTSISMEVEHSTRLSIKHSTQMKCWGIQDHKLNKVQILFNPRTISWSNKLMDLLKAQEMDSTLPEETEYANPDPIQSFYRMSQCRISMIFRLLHRKLHHMQGMDIYKIEAVAPITVTSLACKRGIHSHTMLCQSLNRQQTHKPTKASPISKRTKAPRSTYLRTQMRPMPHSLRTRPTLSSLPRSWSLVMISW